MSNSVFPDLPGLDVAVQLEPTYRTTVHETVAGKEYRTAWGVGKRFRYRLRFNVLREAVSAPAPWAGYNEKTVVEKFHDDHLGSFDSFLFTGPDGVQRRVRFASDTLTFVRIVSGLWELEAELVSVL
jgi:hypothetical protein